MDAELFSSPHTLTPPTTKEQQLSWLRLLRSRRVGVSTFFRLMGEHGSAEAALKALPKVAEAAGVKGYAPCPPEAAEREMRAARKSGARMICIGSPEYPARLAEIPDPPPFFWAIGNVALLQRPVIALVGARNASSLGIRMARRMAGDLAEAGFAVVSGLARGIDAAAHEAALAGGTIAVQAGGVDVLYPKENAELAARIAESGLRLGEDPIGRQPQARDFPRRNRIISGLARAVVVIEAAARSGSLITARDALDQGREVLAVPGHPFDGRAAGCNMLIRDGATLVRSARDVIEAIGHPDALTESPTQSKEEALPDPPPRPTLREANTLHNQILERLAPSPIAEDQLIRDLALPARRITPELTTLELEGRIRRAPGGLVSLA